jgi:hypothetical protein
VTLEQEQEAGERILKFIKDRRVETAAILVSGSFKNMSRLGGMVARFFLGPLVLFLPHDVEQYTWVLEKEENIDWLLERLENEKIETE